MWMIFGLMAAAATFINLYQYKKGKEYKFAMAMGLSFTAATLWAEYRLVFKWVEKEDWSALLDVVPTMVTLLSVLTLISIVLNMAPMLLELKAKK